MRFLAQRDAGGNQNAVDLHAVRAWKLEVDLGALFPVGAPAEDPAATGAYRARKKTQHPLRPIQA